MPRRKKQSSEAAVRDIRRKTRRRFSAEEKIRIVLDGLRGEVSVAEQPLSDVSFTDANTGTVVSWSTTPTILRTTDGGATWTAQNAPPGTDQFSDVSFTDTNAGTIVGAHGFILRTRDGGATWWEQPPPEFPSLSGVSFIDRNTGIAVGDGGIIFRRADGEGD